ncbi:MAG: ATP-dependent Clp protease ATP-binding subunit [Oscillospiraceae bacterium]|nr:ATP-dependent Clp protease ATP-binding subunit [Oscillospiraceae bacterium]
MLCSRCKKNPAVFFISKVDGDKATNEGLCIKCAMELNIGPVKQIMENMGITEEDMDDVSAQMEQMMESMGDDGFEFGGAGTFPFMQGMFGGQHNNDSIADGKGTDEKKNKKKKQGTKNDKRKFLGLYCTDLTQRARENKLDRIIGREQEIARTVQILCRRTKNNPCLIGEPGVGKTAIAEGLAQRIAEGSVPAKLADKEIQLLDLTALVAGTQFRGQFESRIKGLVEEVKSEGNIILFIDEVHNLIGTGDAEGSMNAANILKPALSRGEIQVIGATTFNEYRKHIEKDAALERRFQTVKVEEPSIDDSYKMLLGIKNYYENFHRVKISDNLVYKAVTLSERYITDRFLPDKAIDLLDEACTCANLRNKAISELEIAEKKSAELEKKMANLEDELATAPEGADLEPIYAQMSVTKGEIDALSKTIPELTERAKDNAVVEEDLAKVINLWTGIPVSKVVEGDINRLKDLETNLLEKIIGQDEAVKLVANAIKRSRIQLTIQKRPASFIFVGPTGVGKTELVKKLSEELFDTPETLIRLDMSEFMEKHSVSRLIGSPPGYVGYDEAGQLTEKVRRKPYSIILLDEIEKAHPDVMNILLQILDEGKTNDAHGRTVSFANTVIIMTSNAGSHNTETSLGFGKTEGDISREKVMKALKEFLRPEFIGRVDEIVVFNPLSHENYKDIAKLMLSEIVTVLQDKGIEFIYGDEIPEVLVNKMDGNSRGARDLRNVIRRNIEDKVSNMMIINSGLPINQITVSVQNGEIVASVN